MKIKPRQLLTIAAGAALAALFALAQPAEAAPIPKADNASALNLGAAWTGGLTPGTGDIAVWDATVQSNTNDDPLGAALAWSGIQIVNPGGPITIPSDGNTLTLGASGINLYQASESLILSNKVAVGAPEYWQVGNGQTLDLEGVLTFTTGSALMFSFDTNTLDQMIIDPTITGTVVASSGGTLVANGTIGEGTGSGCPIATVNDVDFAALNSSYQIVPESSLGLNTANPNGAAPTLGSVAGIYDFSNTNSYGGRIAGTYYIMGMRFNTPQPNPASANTYAYNGVGSWNVYFKASNTLDVNSILVTTNVGKSYVVFTPAGVSVLRIADTPNELVIFQNNPAASLVFQLPISNRTAGGIVSKLGVGTLEYQALMTYTGGTQVHGGTLLIDGPGSAGLPGSAGPITVYSGANVEGQSATTNAAPLVINNGGTNSVLLTVQNGTFVNSNNVTFYAGTTWLQFIYSNNIVPSATAAAMLVTNGSLTVSNTVNVNVLSSSLSVGQFPLIKYAALVTNSAGSAFPFNLVGIQPHIAAYLSNNVANSSVDLVVTSVSAEPLHWAAGSGAWNIGVTSNWQDGNGNPATYQQVGSLADNVVFNDLAAGPSPVVITLNTNVVPGAVTVSDSTLNYVISGTGSIGGAASFTKSGTGTVTLGTANSFAGGLFLDAGVLNFSALTNLGSGAITFAGGELAYNGNTDDISTRLVTFGAGGATISTAGQTVNYANPVGNGGAGGLTLTGGGSLTLNGTNKYTGVTTVSQGTLALGAGSYISTSPAIVVSSGAVFDTATSGIGLNLASGQILAGSGAVKGEITNGVASVITPATNGAIGTLSLANDLVVSGGTLDIDLSTTGHDLVAVTGNLSLSSGFLQVTSLGTLTNGVYKVITYGGSLLSGSGSSANLTLAGFSQAGAVATLSDAKPGEIDLIVATGAHDAISWSGATGNTWDLAGTQDWVLTGTTAPWAFTNDDTVRFDDTATGSTTIELEATVLPTIVTVSNNAVATYDFEDGTGVGGGRIGGVSSLVKDGPGTLVNDTASAYTGPTTIKNGVLQIGNGGIGDIGAGNITNNASLVFDQGDYNALLGAPNPHYVTAPISGTGTVTIQGSSPVVLSGNNTYSGGTFSSGTLQVGIGSTTGTLGAGVVTNNGSLVIDRSGSLTLNNTLTGTGPVAFVGPATVRVGGVSSDQNNTYISNGIVKLGSSTAIYSDGTAGDWLILDGSSGGEAGTLDLNGHNLAVNAISGLNVNVNGVIENNGGSTTNTLSIIGSATTTYAGTLEDNSGTGGKIALVVNGGATQTFDVETAAGNAFSGGTVISNSTVELTQASEGVQSPAVVIGLGTGPVTLYNGTLYAAGATASSSPTYISLPNNILVPANYTGTIYGPQRGVMEANVFGGGLLTYVTTYVRGSISGNWSGFTGQIIFGETTTGGNLGIGSTNGFGHVFCTNSSGTSGVYLYNTVAGTPTIPIGELADDGSATIEAAASGNAGGAAAFFAVGGLNTSTNFGGSIIDDVGIIKVGTGSWTLTGTALTYSNSTTISNGVLVLATNVANATTATLPNTTLIKIAAPGILDVSAAGTLTLGAGLYPQTLEGGGTLNGSLAMTPGLSTVAPGGTNGIATLTITNDANLAGTTVLDLDRTNATGLSDEIVSATVEAAVGTLIVTNIGPDLHTGDTFHLFSQPVTGSFASITLPVTTASGAITYVWTNNLAVNGTISLLVGTPNVNTNPTNITASLNGNILSLSWPADHTGWRLLVQTNNLAGGLSANSNDWATVAGSTLIDSTNITISPAQPDEFYRLVYP